MHHHEKTCCLPAAVYGGHRGKRAIKIRFIGLSAAAKKDKQHACTAAAAIRPVQRKPEQTYQYIWPAN